MFEKRQSPICLSAVSNQSQQRYTVLIATAGEFFTDDVKELTSYLDQFDGKVSLFDTTLHYNFKKAVSSLLPSLEIHLTR